MLVERLSSIGVTESVPGWRELTDGEGDLVGQVNGLPAETLPVLTEALTESWEEVPDEERVHVCSVIAARVADVADPLSFAAMLDRLTAAVALLDEDTAERLQQRLLDTVREYGPGRDLDAGAARGRFALGAAVDLVCAGATRPYAVMALLDELRHDLPPHLAAPVAKAAGRLAEQRPDELYTDLLHRALEVQEAEGDACVELGHARLRDAAASPILQDALAALDDARRFYRDAIAADETRPDAAAFAAATELTLAFASGADAAALAAPIEEMERAARELTLYEEQDAPSRTTRHVGAWFTLAARLRGAAEVLSGRGVLELERALVSLLDVYADSRLRVLGAQGQSFEIVISPRIERWVANNPLSRRALVELCANLPAGCPWPRESPHLWPGRSPHPPDLIT